MRTLKQHIAESKALHQNVNIDEKLIINKDFKRIGADIELGNWEVVDDSNGYIHIRSNNTSADEITTELFKKIVERKGITSIDAHEKFMRNNDPILVAWSTNGNDNYALFNYDKSLFGGKYMIDFINNSSDESSGNKMEIVIRYARWFEPSIIKNSNCWAVYPDEVDEIMNMYVKIENLAEYKNR